MTEWSSAPKAQIHGGPLGTVNLQNDHVDEKYFGKNVAFASGDCLFNFGSSKAKIWTVPWSEETQRDVDAWLKFMQYIVACNRESFTVHNLSFYETTTLEIKTDKNTEI